METQIKLADWQRDGGLQISSSSGERIVIIRCNGQVEVNPAFTTEEAARAFWDAVKKLAAAESPCG